MRLGPASWRRLALAAALAVGASGCGLTHLHDLNFRVDDRLHFLTPKDRSTVHAPLTVAWTMRDFTVAMRQRLVPTVVFSSNAAFLPPFAQKPSAPLVHPSSVMRELTLSGLGGEYTLKGVL